MPLYEYKCQGCGVEMDLRMSIVQEEKFDCVCPDCEDTLKRFYKTPPNFKIPSNMTYDGNVKISGGNGKHESRVPINIIDEMPDGSCKVTRIGKKSDIDNE